MIILQIILVPLISLILLIAVFLIGVSATLMSHPANPNSKPTIVDRQT